ncbi:hypothetical protein BLNAU_15222 [Blattamonas nauphoetae]|uniref:Uncharacterized protein n=1 Tax=Blattamonas nauphoetae TaxID=2049346 RepID=A0ABQ9XGR8_9EUKA|nr:hypothetical protein BLNAU_15222 [Blattamonas nauphoetae]
MKEGFPFDDALVSKAVVFFETISPASPFFSVDDFLFGLVPEHVDPVVGFIEALWSVLASSEHRIVESALAVLESTFDRCSTDNTLKLLNCNMISGVMTVIRPPTSSLSAGNVLHTRIIRLLKSSLFEARNLDSFDVSGSSRQSQLNDAIFERILIPSEAYLRYLCLNRYFIMEGQCLHSLLDLLSNAFTISLISSTTLGTKCFGHSVTITKQPPSSISHYVISAANSENIVLWIDDLSFSKLMCAPVAPNPYPIFLQCCSLSERARYKLNQQRQLFL